MIGVDRQEINNSAKATSSRMVRGVAGLSNIARGRATACAPSGPCLKPGRKRASPRLANTAQSSNGFDLSQHWQGHCRSPETVAKGGGLVDWGEERALK